MPRPGEGGESRRPEVKEEPPPVGVHRLEPSEHEVEGIEHGELTGTNSRVPGEDVRVPERGSRTANLAPHRGEERDGLLVDIAVHGGARTGEHGGERNGHRSEGGGDRKPPTTNLFPECPHRRLSVWGAGLRGPDIKRSYER